MAVAANKHLLGYGAPSAWSDYLGFWNILWGSHKRRLWTSCLRSRESLEKYRGDWLKLVTLNSGWGIFINLLEKRKMKSLFCLLSVDL